MYKVLPRHNAEILMHHRTSDDEESNVYPVTMYSSIINAPHLTSNINTCYGAEFVLLNHGMKEVSDTAYNRFIDGLVF